MKQRCYNIKHHMHKNYGGRGITICKEWLQNRRSFIDWALQNGYMKGLSIDRINNNIGYSLIIVDGLINIFNHKIQEKFILLILLGTEVYL